MEQAPDSQDVCSGVAQEGESVADTSDWCSEWSRTPPNSWNEEEKSNQKHDTCGAGEQNAREQQDGCARNRRAVARTPVTVTVRVTASRGAGEARREQSRMGEGGGGGKAGWEGAGR